MIPFEIFLGVTGPIAANEIGVTSEGRAMAGIPKNNSLQCSIRPLHTQHRDVVIDDSIWVQSDENTGFSKLPSIRCKVSFAPAERRADEGVVWYSDAGAGRATHPRAMHAAASQEHDDTRFMTTTERG